MKPYEMNKILNSITLIVDTREQETESLKSRIEGTKFPFVREKLDFADYSYKYVDEKGNTVNMKDKIAIERKMSLDEICGNFTKGRKRFEHEFNRAVKAGAKIHLIIENGSLEKITGHEYRSKMRPESLLASLFSFADRYNITVHFCKSDRTGALMHHIFYYNLRNKLLNDIEIAEE